MSISRRNLGIVCAAALFASPVMASSPPADKKPEISSGVEFLNIPLPVSRDGRLINYLYMSIELTPAPKKDIWKMRESTHFVRDGIIRATHRADYSDPNNPEKLDTKRAIAMIAAEAARVYGVGAVAKIDVTSVDSKKSGIAKRYASRAAGAANANTLASGPN